MAVDTSFPDLLVAMRALRLPRLLVAVVGLMWRYLFVLVDEVLRLMRAREARSGALERCRACASGAARLAGAGDGRHGRQPVAALVRSRRAHLRGHGGRGYDGEVRGLPRPPVPPVAWAVLAGGLLLLVLILLLGLIL